MIDPDEDYSKQIDLSGLDFDLIEKEFLKSTKKNTIVHDLKNKVQTASAVKKAINDYLFSKMPYPTYGDNDIA